MKRLSAFVSVGRTTHRGASSMRMVVGSIVGSPLRLAAISESVFRPAPGMRAGHERRPDPGLFDVREAFVERALMHQSAAFRGYRDVTVHRIGFAEITAARVERTARVAVPIHKEALHNRHENSPVLWLGRMPVPMSRSDAGVKAKFLPSRT